MRLASQMRFNGITSHPEQTSTRPDHIGHDVLAITLCTRVIQ